MKKLLVWLLTLSLTFCFFSPSFAAKKPGIVKIGVFLPMTGAAAASGQTEWAGIKIANKIKPTVLGKKVKLVLVDTKNDETEASNVVSKLIKKDRVCAMIGGTVSDNTMAGAEVADKARIPIVSPTSSNFMVTQNRKYIFRVGFIDPFQGKVAAKYAYSTTGARKAAIMIDIAKDYCIGLANSVAKRFIKMGGRGLGNALFLIVLRFFL